MNYHTYSIGNFMSSSILTSRYLAPEFRPVEKVITKSTKQTKQPCVFALVFVVWLLAYLPFCRFALSRVPIRKQSRDKRVLASLTPCTFYCLRENRHHQKPKLLSILWPFYHYQHPCLHSPFIYLFYLLTNRTAPPKRRR